MNPPDAGWMPWLDKVGWPLALMIGAAIALFWIGRGLWKWCRPWLDRWILAIVLAKEAEAERHKAMTEAMAKLVDKTIEAQQTTVAIVSEVKNKVPEICKWKTTPP